MSKTRVNYLQTISLFAFRKAKLNAKYETNALKLPKPASNPTSGQNRPTPKNATTIIAGAQTKGVCVSIFTLLDGWRL